MKRMSDTTEIKLSRDSFTRDEELEDDEVVVLPKRRVTMYEIHGALFFGAAQAFQDTINRMNYRPKVLILRMRHVLL